MGGIGIGLIGLSAHGGWAARAHVPALQALPQDFAIRAVAASTRERADASAAKYGIGFATDDPAELAGRPDVDLVVVAVKVPEHRRLVEAALAAGKHVLCEWPLGRSLAEAEQLAAQAAAAGVRSFVGLQARSAPPIRFLRDLIAEGYVGQVLSTTIVADGERPWGGTTFASGQYLNDWATGASMLSIPFGHSVDALCWILGEFDRVGATLALRRPDVSVADTGATIRATAPDQVAVQGGLADGAVASIHFRGGMSRGLGFHWEINGTAGDLIVTGANGHLQYGLVAISGGRDGAPLAPLEVPHRYRSLAVEPASHEEAVAYAYAGIARDLRDGTGSIPSFDDALVRHRLIDRITRAAGAPWG